MRSSAFFSLFGLAIFLSISACGQIDLSRGLLAYYPFDGSAADASGNGNNGNLFNGVQLTSDRQGRPNSAYYFDGVDDYIQIPGGNNLNPSGALSIAFFFNPAHGGQQTLLGKISNSDGTGAQFQFGMDFASAPGALFGVFPAGNGCSIAPTNAAVLNTDSSITRNIWYCLVGTFENGVQKIYLNGVLIKSTTLTWNGLNQCPNADIQLGRWWSGDLQSFQGKIDELRIYDRVITQDEINALCNCSLPADFTYAQDPCTPLQLNLASAVIPGITYMWNIGGTDYPPTNPSDAGLTYAFPSYSNYPVTLKLSFNGCQDSLTKTIPIQVQPAGVILTKDRTICAGDTVHLTTSPGLDFCWQPADYLSDPSSANPVAQPPATTTYHFTTRISQNNLIVNGDFSMGNTGFTSDYKYSPSGKASATYFIGPDPNAWNFNMPACLAQGVNGNLFLINGAPRPNAKVWTENVAVQPNTDYAFATMLASLSHNNPSTLQILINGQPVGPLIQADTNTCLWQQFFCLWNSGASTSAQITIMDLNQNASGNDFALDNISFSALTMLTDSVTITVSTHPAPQITAYKIHDIDCSQPTTELNATGGLTYTWMPAAGLSNPESVNPTVSIDTTTTYIVKGTDNWGCSGYSSVTVNVQAVGKDLFILPNAFTPNGDGHNDLFGVKRWGDVKLEAFSIFNRRGLLVFTTQDPSLSWDGNYHGQPQPADTYVYFIRAKTFCGEVSHSGTVILVR
jgi:gliding motility-associated-like protein